MLNYENIERLKAAMRAEPRQYNQSTYGSVRPSCGTLQCMAGFCMILELGSQEFIFSINGNGTRHAATAHAAGRRFLGLSDEPDSSQGIFSPARCWPDDLYHVYCCVCGSHREQVEVACRALDRMHEDGRIDPDPRYDNRYSLARLSEGLPQCLPEAPAVEEPELQLA